MKDFDFTELVEKSVIDNQIEEALLLSGELCKKTAQKKLNQSNKVNTSILLNSIHSRVYKDGDEWFLEVGSNLDYAPFVEFGTGIYGGTDATYGKYALGKGRQTKWSWYDDSGKYTGDGKEGWVSTRGMKPCPFIYPSVFENLQTIVGILARLVKGEAK